MKPTRREAAAALLAVLGGATVVNARPEELDSILEPLDMKPLPIARNVPEPFVLRFSDWAIADYGDKRKFRCILCDNTVNSTHALIVQTENRARFGTCWTRITDAIVESGLGVRLK